MRSKIHAKQIKAVEVRKEVSRGQGGEVVSDLYGGVGDFYVAIHTPPGCPWGSYLLTTLQALHLWQIFLMYVVLQLKNSP